MFIPDFTVFKYVYYMFWHQYRFRHEFLEVLAPTKHANTYVGIKKSLSTCNTQPKQGVLIVLKKQVNTCVQHIVDSLISGFLPDWKREIEEPQNTITIADWKSRPEFPLLVSYIASEFQHVYNLFHYIPTHNLTTLSGIIGQLKTWIVQHKPKQGNSTSQGFGFGDKNPQQQKRLAKEALQQKDADFKFQFWYQAAAEVHQKFQNKNLSVSITITFVSFPMLFMIFLCRFMFFLMYTKILCYLDNIHSASR